MRLKISQSKKQNVVEHLEARRFLNGNPWGAVGRLVGQDDLEANYPTLAGEGQTVVVIDTGVDYTHPALGAGFGPNFTVIGGYDFVDNDSDPMDASPNRHGTAVAGVIAGKQFTSNGFKYQGIAPDTKIIALRIADDSESVPLDRLQSALQWVIDHRHEYTIAAVNISFGYGVFDHDFTEETLGESLRILAADDIPIVCASGNDGTAEAFGIDYPAAHPDAISVGAVDGSDVITEYTQRSANLDLLAPGSDVYVPGPNSGFAIVSGTSFAAPAVTGTIALMKQVDPGLRLPDVRSILRSSSARNLDSDLEFGTTTGLTFARLDVFRAVKMTELRKPAAAEEAALVGKYAQMNELRFDADGIGHLVYFDSSAEQMKYAVRSSAGLWSARAIVDAIERDQGTYLSMQLDSFGAPQLAFFDAVRGDLRFGSFNGQWTLSTVDSLGSVGLYPSLVIDSNDQPRIAYYYRNRGDIRLAKFENNAWDISNIDTGSDVGRHASLAIDTDDSLYVAYEKTTTGDLKFATPNILGGQWDTTIVDKKTQGVGHIDVGIDSTSTIHISYYDSHFADLKYARLADTTWQVQRLEKKGAVGLYTSIRFDQDDRPRIYFYDRRTESIRRTRWTGTAWSNALIAHGRGKYLTLSTDGLSREYVTGFRQSDRILIVQLVEV